MRKCDVKKMLAGDSEFLCTVIAIYRMLAINKDEAILCMVELMKRQQRGDEFDYEKCIDKTIEEHEFKYKPPKFDDLKKQIIQMSISNMISNAKQDDEEEINTDNEEIEIKIDPSMERDYNDVIAEIDNLFKPQKKKEKKTI